MLESRGVLFQISNTAISTQTEASSEEVLFQILNTGRSTHQAEAS